MRPNSPFRTPAARAPYAPGRFRPLVAAAVAALPLVALACGGGDGSSRRAREATGCARLDTGLVVKEAVLQFIAATQPKPLRFLYIPASDSTLPAAGVQALQDKGPTYLFPKDSASQATVREKLSQAGPWNALLVQWHGMSQPTPETASVRIGGRFVGSENDGQVVPVRNARFSCGTVGDSAYQWRFTGIADEGGA